ncbi:MAG: transketolase [Capsulimonadaceae bacterium]|nr:transketolase [Capsulimonadaceae bacterium]
MSSMNAETGPSGTNPVEDERCGDVADFATRMRRTVLQQAKRAHVGHIGSSLSVVDLLAVLYCRFLRIDDPASPERDRFVLSKGHASLALYSALNLRGWVSGAELNTYCADDTLLGVHPENRLPGVDFSTGSLGQGLSYAAGAALAATLEASDRRVFALLSDAECNEGSTWEAVMFAAHHDLGKLVAIVDANGQQALGYTKDVLDLSPLASRWSAFGWEAIEVDGHNHKEILQALNSIDFTAKGRPHVIVARTVAGKGVDFMERMVKWHYWPMSDSEYASALEQVGEPS